MKPLARIWLSILASLLFAAITSASTDATCLIYKPIDMRSEGTVIKIPEGGFIVLVVPYLSGFSIPEKPYSAIARPYVMDSMRQGQDGWDSNLVSRTGIQIQSNCTFDGNKIKEEIVTVDLSKFRGHDYDPSLEDVLEATLECIRRTSTDKHQKWRRPILKIIGRSTDNAKWKRWMKAFNLQDFSKPFKRPLTPKKKAEQNTPLKH